MSDGTTSEFQAGGAIALGDGRKRLRRLETIFVDAQITIFDSRVCRGIPSLPDGGVENKLFIGKLDERAEGNQKLIVSD